MPDQTPTAPVVGTLVNVGADGQHVELTVRLDIGTDVPDHLFDAPAVTVAAQVPPGPLADAIQRVAADPVEAAARTLLAKRERRIAVARDVRKGRCKAARLTEARKDESRAAAALRAALAAPGSEASDDHPAPPRTTGDPR